MQSEKPIRPSDNLDRATLQKIIDNSFDEIFVTDGKGTTIYVNDNCRMHYGLEPDEMIGKKAWDLLEGGYCFPPVTPVVLANREPYSVEQSTNTGRKILVTATPVLDNGGDLDLIVMNVRDITQINQIKKELEKTKGILNSYKKEAEALRKMSFDCLGMVAHSEKMHKVLKVGQQVAPTDSTILLLGETGTGKGMLAEYLHKVSNRRERPFVTINCAAIPETLIESELFGYDRGAFSGAEREGKAGLIELANEGTLFLDEIGEMPLRLQTKMLQVIQDKCFMRVGGRGVKKVNIRIISATNRDLAQMVKEGTFRRDLFYRLKVIEIKMPPLRERQEDLSPLIHLFLHRYDTKYNAHHRISRECLGSLLAYPWPGNIREMEHLMERLVLTVQGSTVLAENLPDEFQQPNEEKVDDEMDQSLEKHLEHVTRRLVINAYRKLGSSYKVAAALKISQSKASRLIRKYSEADSTPSLQ